MEDDAVELRPVAHHVELGGPFVGRDFFVAQDEDDWLVGVLLIDEGRGEGERGGRAVESERAFGGSARQIGSGAGWEAVVAGLGE